MTKQKPSSLTLAELRAEHKKVSDRGAVILRALNAQDSILQRRGCGIQVAARQTRETITGTSTTLNGKALRDELGEVAQRKQALATAIRLAQQKALTK